MIDKIPMAATPAWLMRLSSTTMHQEPFPLREVLQDSLYYPGAGSDGKPVKWLAGHVHSFIYTDYGVSQSRFLAELKSPCLGFSGYKIVGRRNVTLKELTPKGWAPRHPKSVDGNPRLWRDYIKTPFCIWVVLERSLGYSAEHGPERFSLLYLCSEGAASYQALYNSNGIKPKVLFLINHGFGGNWTNFEEPSKILARSVRDNRAGMPDYLVGRYRPNESATCKKNESHWPDDYPGAFCHYFGGGHRFALWQLNPQAQTQHGERLIA